MAIYTPRTDYSSTANAIATEGNVKQIGWNIKQQDLNTNTLKLQGQSLELSQQSLDLDKAKLVMDATIEAVKLGGQIYMTAEQAQMSTAKTTALDASTQFSELITESVLNGGTKAIQGNDGKWDIQLDPSLEQWRTSQVEAITNSKDSKSVKDWRMQALNEIYASGQSKILAGVLNQSQETIDQQYQLSITKALQTDVQTGSYDMGEALISSRADFSPLQKQVQFAAYQKTVDKNFQAAQVSKIAFTEGLDKATEYAYSLKGFTPEEIQGFV
ncbi:MAG: hypothetical protein EOM48_11635, partial [Bacilli bacterium]|nr:hypothetical protein [Bacilli bacterium]